MLVIRIGFVPSIYTVDEDSGIVNVIVAIINGTLSIDQVVEVVVSTQDNTARGRLHTSLHAP